MRDTEGLGPGTPGRQGTSGDLEILDRAIKALEGAAFFHYEVAGDIMPGQESIEELQALRARVAGGEE